MASGRCCRRVPDRRTSPNNGCTAGREHASGECCRTARQSARRRARTARLARVHTSPFKQAAVIHGLRVPVNLTSRESLRMFNLADIWAARSGAYVVLVSGNDHVHSRRSAHYAGLALDFQSSNPDGLSAMFRLAGYRVLWKVPGHYGHVHVQQERPDDTSPLARTQQMLRRATSVQPRGGPRIGG